MVAMETEILTLHSTSLFKPIEFVLSLIVYLNGLKTCWLSLSSSLILPGGRHTSDLLLYMCSVGMWFTLQHMEVEQEVEVVAEVADLSFQSGQLIFSTDCGSSIFIALAAFIIVAYAA